MSLAAAFQALFAAHRFPQRGFHERDRVAQRLAICTAIAVVTLLYGNGLGDPLEQSGAVGNGSGNVGKSHFGDDYKAWT